MIFVAPLRYKNKDVFVWFVQENQVHELELNSVHKGSFLNVFVVSVMEKHVTALNASVVEVLMVCKNDFYHTVISALALISFTST